LLDNLLAEGAEKTENIIS